MVSLAFLPTVLPWRRQGAGQAGGRSIDRPMQRPTAAVGRGAFVVPRNPSFPLLSGAEPASGSRQAPCFLLRMAAVKAPTAADQNGSGGGDGDGDGGGTATLTAGNIEPSDVTQILSRSYLEYALSVIHARALPDARDGLKPVHRRILYAMSQLGLNPNSQFRKCARVVGEVLGRFHPHGDSAVYDALIRMAQPFSMLEPLVDGQGNLGSVDGDKAAAMRYTECRLTSLSKVALLADLDRDTVDFAPNFDGSDTEPAVMPARVPNLLLNGSHGIAVGMATNLPPHNLSELIAALQALIENPDLSDEEVIAYVPAPDFPTGGLILDTDGARQLYTTGSGSVMVRAKTSFERIRAKGRLARDAIIVHELPYQVVKATLLARIAELVNEKKLDGIADLRDESDRDGMRVVIEMKQNADKNIVLNNLFNATALQTSFGGNMVALVGRKPERLTLKRALQVFVEHRVEVVRRRSRFELGRAREREHIVQGLLTALQSLSEVIRTIREAATVQDARQALTAPEGAFRLSEPQAEAILSMQLRRLTQLESERLRTEGAELAVRIADLEHVLANRSRVMQIIADELREIDRQYGKPRRSQIADYNGRLTSRDVVPNGSSVIIVSKQGYLKRVPLSEFQAHGRGHVGVRGAQIRENDSVAHFFACQDHDVVLAVSERGVAYTVYAFEIPRASRTARGVPIHEVFPGIGMNVNDGEGNGVSVASTDDAPDTHLLPRLSSLMPVSTFDADTHIMLLTRKGWLKRTPLSAFDHVRSNGLIILSLDADDQVGWVQLCRTGDTVVLASARGQVARMLVAEQTLRATGRTSRGVLSMKLRPDDTIADMAVIRQPADGEEVASLLAITALGHGKRMNVEDFRVLGRRTQGVRGIRLRRDRDDRLLCLRTVQPADHLVLITEMGTVARFSAANIPLRSRTAGGVIVQKLRPGDRVAQCSVSTVDDDEEEDEEQAAVDEETDSNS